MKITITIPDALIGHLLNAKDKEKAIVQAIASMKAIGDAVEKLNGAEVTMDTAEIFIEDIEDISDLYQSMIQSDSADENDKSRA